MCYTPQPCSFCTSIYQHSIRVVFLLLCLHLIAAAVVINGVEGAVPGGESTSYPTLMSSFRQCLISQPPSAAAAGASLMGVAAAGHQLGHCFGVGAISKLQSLDNQPQFDLIDGVTLTRDGQQEFRDSSYNFADKDPADLRMLIDSFGHVLSHRSMHWDMSFLYPGLAMHIAPSTSPGGTLEFVLDPHREAINLQSLKEASTGRVLTRQFLVPMLLGFKFNVATLIPIVFGLLALIAKKAVILSKIALIISSAYGLGTLLLAGNAGGNKVPTGAYTGSFNPGFGGHYNRYPEEADEYPHVLYRGMSGGLTGGVEGGGSGVGDEDQLRLYANLQNAEAYERRDIKSKQGRNFAWSDDEKLKKGKT